jgi:hypothetical protein
MTQQELLVARAGRDDSAPRPGPIRIIQRCFAALKARVDALAQSVDAIESSRMGWAKRLDIVDARIRAVDKRTGGPPPPIRTLMTVGPAVSWAAFVAYASWDHLLADVLSSSQPVEQAQPHHRDSKQDHRPSRQEQ